MAIQENPGSSLSQEHAAGEFYWEMWLKRWFWWLLVAGVCINFTGLFITILEPDGALYATIAKTISLTGDFINLKVEGRDWLDKPHFPFWITAISFKLFGINTIAYKLPALIFWAAGGVYTYLFAKSLYSKNVAMLSVLIYLTAAHLVISNNDVRAEPYLTGLVIGSVYHFYKASRKSLGLHLVLGSLLAAFAVMTKGPFVLIVIASGFIVSWILKKEWSQFLHYRWWLAALLTGIFILPEIYSLYQQFDLHPEKVVFGRTGVSGIRFFFWDSQFGRFLNTGPIKGKGELSFYVHTLLWAFLPWSLLLFAALFQRIRRLNFKTAATMEQITVGTSLITFILFSLSRFQLPHYMNIVFPFFSIITAQYLYGLHRGKIIKVWSWIQHVLCFLLVVALLALALFYNLPRVSLIVMAIVSGSIIAYFLFRKSGVGSVVGRSFAIAVLLYGFVNLLLYPALLNYQSGSKAAAYINLKHPGKIVGTYQENSYSFAFYIDQPIEYHISPETIKARTAKEDIILFTSEINLDTLKQSGLNVQVLETFPQYHISKLKGKFLNHRTRDAVTKNMVVARVWSRESGVGSR